MRKALLPMIASLALCGASTVALIATNARAAQTPKPPVMVAMAGAPGITMAENAPTADMMVAPADDMGGAPSTGKMAQRLTQMCKDVVARKTGELAYLEAKLALTPAQTGAFGRWKDVSLNIARHHADACNAHLTKMETKTPGLRPDIIDRMSREEDILKIRLADLQAEKPALAALYNTLTPDQRKDLDRGGMGRPPRMMMSMMHRPGMGPGPMGARGPADMPPPPPPAQ